MKCDRCDNEATVHEVTIQGGKKVEQHLCERCALDAGVSTPPGPPLSKILSQFIGPNPSEQQTPTQRAKLTCSGCALTFAEFRSAGLLGCEACYVSFEAQLGPLIERAHEGATHHVGKAPKHPPTPTEPAGTPAAPAKAPCPDPEEGRRTRERVLRRQLEAAVKAEQYELAAKLRDEIGRLGTGEEGLA